MNNIFDILINKNLYFSYYFLYVRPDEWPNRLIKAKQWINDLELYKPIEIYGLKKSCFEGMMCTLNTITMLYEQ